jgi:hypothetical protein
MTLHATPPSYAPPATASPTALTLDELTTLPRRQLNELFRSSLQPTDLRRAGVMPDGDTQGVAIVGKGPLARRFWARFARILCWQGKVFTRQDDDNAMLVNKITFAGIKAIKARVYRGPSRLDGQECIVLDYSRTSLVAKLIRDEIREVAPGVFLGLVFWGRSNKILLRFALKTGGGEA